MRTLLVLAVAVTTVVAVLFFGLGGIGGEADVVTPPTIAPSGATSGAIEGDNAVTTTTWAAGTTTTRDPDAEPTLVAVTTTATPAGVATTTIAPQPLGTLAPIEGLGHPTLDAGSSVSTVGIDRIMFGMTVHDAQVAAGSRFTPVTPVGHCFLVVPEAGQAGLTFWVVAGTVERVDVDTRTITTRSGAGIGNTEERIREMFGERIHTTPLPNGSGNLLAYVPKDVQDATYRVMFLSNGVQITRMWAGRLPWVEELGGCPT
ncbi:MAG: hypothetical protein CL466_08940 [Acidimicrobiaceae bacterium]|nr:hypothetical protein [Acidimicrobiaceae bacterium]